jgi:hypothetical protein
MSRTSRAIARQRASQSVTIRKTPSTAIGVQLAERRGGEHVIEIVERQTRALPGLFYDAGPKVTLPVTLLPKLRAALESLEEEARLLGLVE